MRLLCPISSVYSTLNLCKGTLYNAINSLIPGDYYFPFAIRLPGPIPFTFSTKDDKVEKDDDEGKTTHHGVIFSAKAKLDIPWWSDKQAATYLNLRNNVQVKPTLMQPSTNTGKKAVGWFLNTSRVECTVKIDKD